VSRELKIPKNIWVYWHQGLDQAPEVVHHCIDSWRRLNPTYDVKILDKDTYSDFVTLPDELKKKSLKKSFAAYTDVLRIYLLAEHGGIWVDSTLFCLKPLHSWLSHTEHDLIAFRDPGPDRLLSSWFLAAKKDAHIIDSWKGEVVKYWSSWRWRRPYYWFHYLFGEIYRKDQRCKEEWDRAPRLMSEGPHHLTPFKEKFFQKATEERIDNLHKADVPVLKLTYKCLQEGIPAGSMIEFVLHGLQNSE